MGYTRHDDFFYVGTMEALASREVYRLFLVNRYELCMLYSLSTYLQIHGKKTVSRKLLTDWLGMSYALEKKAWGYIRGLISKGLVNQMGWRNSPPGHGNSLSISPYGGKVLTAYALELDKLEQKHHDRKSKPGYTDNIVSEPLPGYKLVQLGRNS